MIEKFPTPQKPEKNETPAEKAEGVDDETLRLRQELIDSGKIAGFIDLDTSDLPEGVGESEDITLASIDSYLLRPVVQLQDGAFNNNDERRNWRLKELPLDQRLVVEDDALSVNALTSALGRAYLVILNMPDGTEKEALTEKFNKLDETYREYWGDSANNGYTAERTKRQQDYVVDVIKPFLLEIRNMYTKTQADTGEDVGERVRRALGISEREDE